MPKTPSVRLFHLVKSLTVSEKRYFKIYVNSKDAANSKYVRLFDAIYEQVEFDEAALIRKVYGDAKVESRKYSELKAYLFDLVVKSLQSYDEKSSVDYRIKIMLLGVRTLFKRSHYADCKDALHKAKKLAQQYDDFNTLLEILNWEKRIAYAETDIAFLDRELERITKEEQSYLSQLQDISTYRNLFFNILLSLRKDISRREKQLLQMEEWIKHPLLQDEKRTASYTAKVLYYRIFTLYYFTTSNFEAFYKASKTLLKLMEQNKAMLREDVSEYISALFNHLLACGKYWRLDEFRKTLERLKKVKPITADDELKIHRQYYQAKFRLCINTGEFEEGMQELKKHLKAVEKFDKKQFIKNSFYLQYFCIYFGAGEYENALDSLNEWLTLSGSLERKDLQSLAQILNLIIHYELGNTILLDSLLRSTTRYLKKEDRLSAVAQKMMHFIREAGKPHSKKQLLQLFETLREDFQHLMKGQSYGIFELFDVVAWLESKISGRTFAEVAKERYQQQLVEKSQEAKAGKI